MSTVWTEIGTGTQALVTLPFDNGSVDGDQYPTLNAAITAIGASTKTLVLATSKGLNANLTIPATLQLVIKQGGSIVSNGFTVAINGPFEAGSYQIFSGFAADGVTGLKEINPKWFGTLNNTITVISTTPAFVKLNYIETLTANLTIPATCKLEITPDGSISKASTYTLTINGPFSAGLHQVFSGFNVGDVTFGPGSVKEVYPEWWGAKANDSTDSSTALQIAAAAAGLTKVLILSTGTYRITSTPGNYALTVVCAIRGVSTSKSILYNTGTGSALLIQGASYYTRWENFTVKGNVNSQNGIVLNTGAANPETAYSTFLHVDSIEHGIHGLIHRNAWGTKYIDSKFRDNGGLGIYLSSYVGDPGPANGVVFLNCESRHNGGTSTATTYTDDKGGVKIVGAAMVAFIGGIYESNNAWAFIISNQSALATRSITIRNVYMELNPNGATIGGNIYAGLSWYNIIVEDSWLSYGAALGKTGYCFYVSGGEAAYSNFIEQRNTFVASGVGTNVLSFGLSYDWVKPYVSIGFGDYGAAGTPTTQTILTANASGTWAITGFIHTKRNSDSTGGIYPFIAARDPNMGAGALQVTIGSSIVGTATTPPTIAWNSNNLQVTFAAYHYGHVEVNIGGTTIAPPSTLLLNNSVHPQQIYLRK